MRRYIAADGASVAVRLPDESRLRSASKPAAMRCDRECCESISRFNLVANPAHRLEHGVRESPVDLVAEIVNVYVYHVRERLAIVLPDMIDNLRPREYLTGMPHKVFQQGKLFGGQLDHLAV